MGILSNKSKKLGLSGILFCTLLVAESAGWAALPPIYECEREYQSILHSQNILELLNGNLPTSISNDYKNIVVKADQGCEVHAEMATLPQPRGIAGPRRYEIIRVRKTGCETAGSDPLQFQKRLDDFVAAASMLESVDALARSRGWVSKIEHVQDRKFRLYDASNQSFEIEIAR